MTSLSSFGSESAKEIEGSGGCERAVGSTLPIYSRAVKRTLALIVCVAALPALIAGCGSSDGETASADQTPDQQARELLTNFWTQVKEADTSGLETTLDPSWQLARADGTHLSRSEYIDEVGKGEIDIVNFRFDEISATRSESSIVVRYITTADYTLDGKKYKGTPAPYLGTFIFQDERWQMTSQANFNVPVD